MKLLKQVVYVLSLLLVIALVWVGFSSYLQSQSVEINPNASNYTKPISTTFDIDEIEGITVRIEESFPISPQEFFLLTEETN